ncbi:MAG TPA: hypothetical protein VMV43_04860 [Candidatus Nanopelagicaceae bacterium]|nr:hypothetical protein [Candidatus Nanopelagicaceae bacterium]
MTFYELSVITNTGFPYYNLILNTPPSGVNLTLRFFDFTQQNLEPLTKLDPVSSFELNAGLVSALFEFARNIDKKIEMLEFKSRKKKPDSSDDNQYKGDVLITTQTEPYLLQKSVNAKIKNIYNLVIADKIPLDAALELLQNEEDKIIEILTDKEARSRVEAQKEAITSLADDFLKEMSSYGLRGICITSFDLSPIMSFGILYSLADIDSILRNINVFPNISTLEWIYRQSYFSNEQLWVYIIKSGVGPTINDLFEPYFYLLFADPQSYLGEFPGKLASRFDQILG